MRSTVVFPVLSGLLLMSLSACGPGTGGAASNAAGETGAGNAKQLPVVLTSFSVLEDIAAAVGGDLVDTRSITPPGAEVH